MRQLTDNTSFPLGSVGYTAELSDLPTYLGGTNASKAFLDLLDIFSYQFISEMAIARLRHDIFLTLSPEYSSRDHSWIKLAYESARISDISNEIEIIRYARAICGNNIKTISDDDIYYIVSVMLFFSVKDYLLLLAQEQENNSFVTRVSINTLKQVSRFLSYYEQDGELMSRSDEILFSQEILPEHYYALKNDGFIERKNIRFLVESGFTTEEEILDMYNNLPSELFEDN